MLKRLLKMAEVAEALGITEDHGYQLAREGLLPVVRLGRLVRVDQARLDEWITNGGKGHAESRSATSM